jgi:PKD repeat protein
MTMRSVAYYTGIAVIVFLLAFNGIATAKITPEYYLGPGYSELPSYCFCPFYPFNDTYPMNCSCAFYPFNQTLPPYCSCIFCWENGSYVCPPAYGTNSPNLNAGFLDANFTSDITTGLAPLEVSFTDLSTGNPNAWLWDFGDGTTSADKNPVHTYTAPGYYSVSLTVSLNYAADGIYISQSRGIEKPNYIYISGITPGYQGSGGPAPGQTVSSPIDRLRENSQYEDLLSGLKPTDTSGFTYPTSSGFTYPTSASGSIYPSGGSATSDMLEEAISHINAESVSSHEVFGIEGVFGIVVDEPESPALTAEIIESFLQENSRI